MSRSFTLPAINMRRTLLIARRDFLGYVRTWGFWITALSPFFGIAFGLLMSLVSLNAEPIRYVSILDDTGRYEARIVDSLAQTRDKQEAVLMEQSARFFLPEDERETFKALLDDEGAQAGRAYLEDNYAEIAGRLKLPENMMRIAPIPENTLEAMMPYVTGQKRLSLDGESAALSGLLQIYDSEDGVQAKYWTTNSNATGLSSYAEKVFLEDADAAFFEATGKSREDYIAARGDAPTVQKLDPTKTVDDSGAGQEITIIDNIPSFVAAGFSLFLWLSVFSGAYMLLMSMVEEKINKALEMLLASTRFTEILFGKLLGVAALTVASMGPWLIMGGLGLLAFMTLGDGAAAAAIGQAISGQMIGLFALFFVMGYIFYGALFMALGSLAESMQDAQTLVTPILLLLTLCLMVVPIGLNTPDSPLVRLASFIPFSAPFAILIRLPSEPPVWEIVLSAGILLASTLFVVWLSARMFRYGVLSGGGVAGIKLWFSRVVLRRG